MNTLAYTNRFKLPFRIIAAMVCFAFLFTCILPPGSSYAQGVAFSPLGGINLPVPGAMVSLTPGYVPPFIKGVTIDPVNPLKFNFIVHKGDSQLDQEQFKDESNKLVKYFLAALTVPEDDLWVNLSPYEKDRIIPEGLGGTELGRDLLAQDYILKQLTASLIYPEDDLGGEFWDKIHRKARELYGTTDIPINTFNKVWIVPKKAVVYENGNTVYVTESHLSVLLEEDYLTRSKNSNSKEMGIGELVREDSKTLSSVSSEIIKEVIIPAIEKEVNEGKNFAQLRQIYNSIILAAWYKQALKDGLLSRIYIDQNKIFGIDVQDVQVKQKIYDQYIKAFTSGVYNYIKEDHDPVTQELIPRKYFSGGAHFVLTKPTAGNDEAMLVVMNENNAASSPVVVNMKKVLAENAEDGFIQEVSVVLAEPEEVDLIISEIGKESSSPVTREYADVQEALVDVGFSNAEVEDLLNRIEKNQEDEIYDAGGVYRALASLVRAVKDEGLNESILDKDLLQTIARNSIGNMRNVYSWLKSLAEGVKNDGVSEVVLDIDLLQTIAQNAKRHTDSGYSQLKSLADGVKNEGLSEVVLDINLLQAIAQNTENHKVSAAYSTLESLAKAGVVKDNNFNEVGDLLIKIAQNTGAHTKDANKALVSLVEIVKDEELSKLVLDMDLLRIIAFYTSYASGNAYNALVSLSKAVKDERLNEIVLDVDLLQTIAQAAKLYTDGAYKILESLARAGAVNDKSLDNVKNLLQTMGESQGSFAVKSPYIILGSLAKASVIKDDNIGEARNLVESFEQRIGEYAEEACRALDSITEAGAVNEENFNEVQHLIITISEKMGKEASVGYESLKTLAEAGVVQEDNLDKIESLITSIGKTSSSPAINYNKAREALVEAGLDRDKVKDLLQEILNDGRGRESRAYNALASLAQAVKIEGLNENVLNMNLLLALAENSGDISGPAYEVLESLAQAVKNEGLNENVLDIELLKTIMEKIRGYPARFAYESLVPLARAAKDEGLDEIVLDVKLLKTIAETVGEQTGDAYKVLVSLAGADFIKDKNIDEVIDLLQTITQASERYSLRSFSFLASLAKVVKEGNLNENVLEMDLLKTIAQNAGEEIARAYRSLGILAKAVKDEGLDKNALDLDLLKMIPQTAGERTGYTYESLLRLFKAVKEEGLDENVLEMDLLKTIAQMVGGGGSSYGGLVRLARVAKGEEFVLDINLLQTIAQISEDDRDGAYNAFALSYWAVGNEGLSNIVLDLNLFMAIAQAVGDDSRNAYEALKSLSQAGVVNEGNIEEIQNLITAIAEKMGDEASLGYESLKTLAEAGIVQENNLDKIESLITSIGKTSSSPIIELSYDDALNFLIKASFDKAEAETLLKIIEKNVGQTRLARAGYAYGSLASLVKEVNDRGLNKITLDIGLLQEISQALGIHTSFGYDVLSAFARAGVIKDDNVDDVKDLLRTITEPEKDNTWRAYSALESLAKTVEAEDLNKIVLDIDLLKWIAKIKEDQLSNVYKGLESLAKAVKAEGLDDGVLDLELLKALAQGTTNPVVRVAYSGLEALARAVKEERLDDVVLDRQLLMAIARTTGDGAEGAYEALVPLAQAVKHEKINKNVLDIALLESITEMTRENTSTAYRILKVLASVDGIKADDFEWVKEFLQPVNQLQKKPGGHIYHAVNALAAAGMVKKDNFDEIINFLKTIVKNVGDDPRQAYSSFQSLVEHKVVRDDNFNEIKRSFIAIAQSAADMAYLTLESLARAGAVNADNFDRIKDLLQTIAQNYSDSERRQVYHALISLARATRRKDVLLDMDILETIAQNTEKKAADAYEGLASLVKDWIIAQSWGSLYKGVDEIVFDRNLLLAIAQVAGDGVPAAYKELIKLGEELKSAGLQEMALNTNSLEMITRSAKRYAKNAYKALKALARAGVVNEGNIEEIQNLITAIAEKMGDAASLGYESLKTLAEAGIVQEDNLDKIESLITSIGKTSSNPVKVPDFSKQANIALVALVLSGVVSKSNTEEVEKVLIIIAEKCGRSADAVYQIFGALARVEIVTAHNMTEAKDLFIMISREAAGNAANIFKTLNDLVKSVEEKRLSRNVLELNLLTKYFQLFGKDAYLFYGSLKDLAEAVKAGGSSGKMLQADLLMTVSQNLSIELDDIKEEMYIGLALLDKLVEAKGFSDTSINELMLGLKEGVQIVSAYNKSIKNPERNIIQKLIGHFHLKIDAQESFEGQALVSAREISLDFFKQRGAEDDFFQSLVPENVREEIYGSKLEEIFIKIDQENYLKQPYLAAVYLKIIKSIPMAIGLTYPEFLSVVQGGEDSQYSTLIIRFIEKHIFQRETQLTKSQQKRIVALSIALHKHILEKVDGAKQNVTFRELARFNIDFSRFYLQQQGLEKTLEFFILTAHNIYGRVLKNDNDKNAFIHLIGGLFKSPDFRGLVGEAQMDSEDLRGDIIKVLNNIIKYADYENLDRTPQDNEVPLRVSIRSLLERARQVQGASLLMVDDNNTLIVDEVLDDLAVEEDTIMLRLPINGFSKRRELFGMYIPKEALSTEEVNNLVISAEVGGIKQALKEILALQEKEVDSYYDDWQSSQSLKEDVILKSAIASFLKYGEKWQELMNWQDGLLVKVAQAATKNLDKQYYINFDNISAMPDTVRLLLNPVMWERMVEIPERSLSLTIPDNLNFILTMHKDTEIKDESFMNRPLVQYVDALSTEDMRKYLKERFGLEEVRIKELTNIYSLLSSLKLTENVVFSFTDIIDIAKRVKGLAEETQKSEEEILWKEAYDYLYLRVMNERDREILREKVFNGKDFDSPEILVNRIDGTIIFDGVVLVGSKGFLEYVENNHEKSFRELARGYKDFAKDGYIVTEMEARVLSQLARAYRYGNRVVQIEGPSGEGKTEVGRVFSKLIGLGAREYTINQETDLSEFRGQIRPTRDRRYELYEPNYLKEVDEGNHAFLFNEINTNEAGALYYWLFPEIAQRAKKDLGEFAVDHDDLVKTLKIDQNNLWLFTVNPESFHGRGMIPPRIRSHVTTFYMAQDLDSLPQTTEGLFKRNQLDRYLPYSNKLASIHRAFRELKEKQRIESPQDITPRELISVTDKFRHYLKEGMEAESAFRRAIDEVYVYMWKELKDVQQARVAVNENLGYADGILGREVLEAALTKKGRPVLVFFNGANNLNDLLKKEVLSSDKETVVRHIPLSHFHHRRQFVGGLIPSEQVESRDGRWQKLNELSAQFEESLGIIPELIKETRFNPRKEVLSILYNYTHLNPQVAPLLNEFFQTGRLEGVEDIVTLRMAEELIEEVQRRGGALWDDLRSEYGRDHTMVLASDLSEEQKLQFAQWFYGEAPDNLRFIATGSSEEKVTLSPAEINRFLPVNIAQDLNKEWINGYISGLTDGSLAVHAGLIKELIHEVFNLYEKQRMEMEYEYNRMSRLDIDAFLKELRDTENLNEQSIKKVAFYSLGIGLRPDYRAQLKYSDAMENPTELIRYEQRSDGIYLMVDGIKYLTKSENIPSLEFLAPTKNLVQQLAAMIIALKYNRVLAIEGHPGGGKTASVEDLARRLGLPVYNQMMYEDIDLGEFLGKLSKEGKKFVLTSRKKDLNEKYVIPFLRAYSQGGLFLLDEGAIGLNSQEVISFLVELSLLDEFNLGIFHPGFKEEVLKKHKDFHLVIAQNPARTTKAREPLPYRVDTIAHKIWTDNILRKSDAVRIIDYHLDQADKVPQDIKNEIAEVHIELSKVHPKKESLSPRQLIMIARTINQAIENGEEIEKAVFEGIMISYLTGLSGDDLKKMLDVIGKKTQNNLLHYIGEWKDAIDVTHNKTYVQFNGTKLPKSITKGNVKEEDVIYREDLPSQSQALRSMALGMSLNMPLAVFEEEGSDALDLIKKFSYLVNYELHTLWSHPQMTRMQILSAILPKFEAQLDRYGVKQEDLSDEFVMSLGFLVRHLMLQKDYDELKEEQRSEQVQKVLFFHLMDAIPERQRVLLNELLTTGKMELTNEKGEPQRYVLPEWVHFVVSASLEHDFSSAFINRFLPIRLNSILKLDELKNVVQNRYPLVKDYEVSWIRKIAMAVSKYDKNEVFGIHYGYSVRDIYKLARLIHLEKQGDIKKGEFNTNPLYYMLKAAHIVYGLGLEDGDRKKYEEEIIKEHFLGSLVMGGTPEEIENLYSKLKTLIEFKLAKVQREVYDLHVDISSIESGRNVVLENGINIQKTEQGFVISTRDANVYHVYEALDDWKELSEGLKIKREENQLIFSLNLLQSVGEVPFPRDENNRSVSLPEDEVPTREFVRYTDQVNRLMAGTLRGWQRVQDGLGGVRSPRVMMWNGHTGTAKTTLARNLSRVWGVPIYILNAYEEMKVSDITVGLKFQEGTFEIGIKEFLARVGKINGQRIAIASKETSSRKILLIDEANASPDMLYALAPLFRGEKKFSVEYAGENFKVEVDDEVLIILTFNPSEKYAGRGGFSRDIVSYADKLWMPNPLNYQEDVLASILSEYHRRGITSQKKNIKKQEPQEVTISKERHVKSEPYIVKVEELEHPQVQNLKEVLLPNEKRKTRESEGAEESLSDEGAKRKAPIERVQLNYDVEKIKANARRFVEGDGYKNFAVGVLEEGFLYSLADNNMDGELEMEVINAAGRLDSQVQKALEDLIKIYARKSHKLSEVYEKILEMRRIFARNRVALFIVRKSVQKKYSYFGLVVEEIERIVVFDENKLKKIGEDPSKYQNIAISAIVTEGDKYGAEEKGIAGFFEGEYAYAFKGASLAGARAAGFKDVDKHEQELVDWTADHELGHVMDLLRIRSRGINIAKNIKWSQLAQDVNRQNKGIWLSENVELNSMLFPIIFSSNPKEYIMQELIRIVKTHKDYKDAYVQASKGILNGFLSYFEEKGKIRDVKLISNSLEDEHVEVILNFIEENYFDEKDSEELNQIGAIIYKEAEKYLKTTGKGIYRRKEVTGVGGDSMEEVIYGDMAQPDIEKEYVEGKEGDGYEFDTPQAQEGRSITVAESKQYAEGGSGGQEGGEDQGEQVGQSKGEGLQGVGEVLDDKDIDASGIAQDISKLQEVAPNLVAKFLDIFAGSPKTLKIYSDTGDEIDIERIITGDLEPFYRAKVMEGLASLSAGITVDISGSTSGELRASFIEMTKLYSSLFYYSAVRNKGVSFSISAVGDHFHSILDFDNSRDKLAVENAITLFDKIQDWGGINTLSVIEGIRKKYLNQKDKSHKLELIFTDGGETSGESFEDLRKKVEDLEKELGIDIVFVGIGTRDVENYSKYINIDYLPPTEELSQLIINLSLLKISRGTLPYGDLKEFVGMDSGKSSSSVSSPVAKQNFRQDIKSLDRIGSFRGDEEKEIGGIDLSRDALNLEIKRNSRGIPLPIQMQNIENININGFVPIIINISPIMNFPLFSGLSNEPGNPKTTKNADQEPSRTLPVDRLSQFYTRDPFFAVDFSSHNAPVS